MGAPGAAGAGRGTEGGGAGCWGGNTTVLTHPALHGIGRRGIGDDCAFLLFLSFVNSFGALSHFLGEEQGEVHNEPPCADGGRGTDCTYSSP